MIHTGHTKAEVAALVQRLSDASAAAERYATKAKIWATERDRVAAELVKAVSGSQDEVSIELVSTVERPSDGTSTPSL